MEQLPEFYGSDVAHSAQQGSLAEPPGDVGPQLGFCLRGQAAVDQRQAANRPESQSVEGGAWAHSQGGVWKPLGNRWRMDGESG